MGLINNILLLIIHIIFLSNGFHRINNNYKINFLLQKDSNFALIFFLYLFFSIAMLSCIIISYVLYNED